MGAVGLRVGLLAAALSLVACQADRKFAPEPAGGSGGESSEPSGAGEGAALAGSASIGGAPDKGPVAEMPDESLPGLAGAAGAGGAPETEVPVACTEDEYDDGSGCQPLTTCTEDEFEQSPPTTDKDRVCAAVAKCSDDEYVKAPATPVSNRECSPFTVCRAGTEVESEPTAQSDRICSACPPNTFSSTLNAAGCSAWFTCQSGETQSVPPSPTSDRVCSVCGAGKYAVAGDCVALTVCTATQYEEAPATATSDRKCKAATSCLAGSRQTAAPTNTTDRQCAPCSAGTYSAQANAVECTPWSQCGADQYASSAPSLTQNRGCSSLTTCPSGTRIKVAATATSDRVCEPCPNGNFSSTSNVSSCQAWIDCSAGSWATAGSATKDRVCTTCVNGTFSTAANAGSCKPWKTCTASQKETAAGTSTSDVVCVDKPVCSSAPDRVCTIACPCASGEGVCTASAQCLNGAACVQDGGKKFGRTGDTCLVSHCDNDQKDSGETSVDCGGGCGCQASFEVVDYKGIPAGASFFGLKGMSGNGSRFVANFGDPRGSWAPAAVDADGNVTELEHYGKSANVSAISADGNVILGSMACTDPPACSDLNFAWMRWTGSAAPTVVRESTWGNMRKLSASGALILGDRLLSVDEGVHGFLYGSSSVTYMDDIVTTTGMSPDGKYVIGYQADGSAGLWYSPTKVTTKITNSNWDKVDLIAINGTTPAVVGYGTINATHTEVAYRWMGGQLTEFAPLPGGGKSTRAAAVSADGSKVVGVAEKSQAFTWDAFIWTAAGGLRTIVDELLARGYEPPSDLTLDKALFISDDGKIIVGEKSSSPPTFWRVILN